MSKNILFITETLFKDRTSASTAIDSKQIFPMIKVAQDVYIQPILGSTLYKRLQEGIDANNLGINEKVLLDDYITDALVWFTMSMLPMTMGYQLFSKGFLQKTSEESAPPSQKDLELIEEKYKKLGEYYNARTIAYLQENYLQFYTYLNPDSGVDVIFPETKSYTCPIYLGDGRGFNYINSQSGYVAPMFVYYTATGGETEFNVPELFGRTVLAAFRSGLNKVITADATNDTGYLRINNGIIHLPTGDVAMAGELFTFLFR